MGSARRKLDGRMRLEFNESGARVEWAGACVALEGRMAEGMGE
jgi:hypothetical protein